MTTATAIRVGDTFGYRKVVAVTSRTISYINLNGRKLANGRKVTKQLTVHSVTRAEFRELVGL